MPTETPTDFATLFGAVDRFGLPLSILFVILWGMVRVARWLGPRIDSLVKRHEKLIDTIETEQKNHGLLLSKMHEGQSRQLEVLLELKNLVHVGGDSGPRPRRNDPG